MSASERRIYFLLQRAAHQVRTGADESLTAACGLTTSQTATLSVIAESGPTNQRQVARALAQRESAVATMTLRLLKAGYISRTRSSSDARAWELEATDSGRDALAEATTAFEPVNAALDASLTATQSETLADALEQIIQVFDRGRDPQA